MSERLFLSPPWQTALEADYVSRSLASNWLAPVGPELDRFETELAAATATAASLATGTGTSAIHLALRSVGVKPGDVVVVPSLTFIGSASPVVYLGAEPWFVDSSGESWNLDPDLLDAALAQARAEGRRVGAVVAVDLFGQCADYDRIERICEAHSVPVVEDAAEALGSSYEGHPAGSLGRVGVLSFNGNKIITTSGGGALVSDDVELIERCRYLATQAREPVVHYEHEEIGYNYRLSNVLAALGRAQLATLDERVAARRRIFDVYSEALDSLEGIAFMPEAPYGQSNRWLTTLTVEAEEFGASNLDIIRHLETLNIESRPVWKPMHQQPVFAAARMFGGEVCEALYDRGLALPSGTGMSDADIERVVAGVLASRST